MTGAETKLTDRSMYVTLELVPTNPGTLDTGVADRMR
jgi:hypothetical protein